MTQEYSISFNKAELEELNDSLEKACKYDDLVDLPDDHIPGGWHNRRQIKRKLKEALRLAKPDAMWTN